MTPLQIKILTMSQGIKLPAYIMIDSEGKYMVDSEGYFMVALPDQVISTKDFRYLRGSDGRFLFSKPTPTEQ